jgi:predicted secreted protein
LIEESVKNAEGGVSINEEVLSNLRDINEQVNKVSEVMAEIASASDQQSQGIDQITTSVGQMSEMTQQNAANSQESAASAVELDNLAHKMQKMVDAFNLGFQHKKESLTGDTDMAKHAETLKAKLSQKLAKDKSKESKPNGHDSAAKLIPFEDDFETLRDF